MATIGKNEILKIFMKIYKNMNLNLIIYFLIKNFIFYEKNVIAHKNYLLAHKKAHISMKIKKRLLKTQKRIIIIID